MKQSNEEAAETTTTQASARLRLVLRALSAYHHCHRLAAGNLNYFFKVSSVLRHEQCLHVLGIIDEAPPLELLAVRRHEQAAIDLRPVRETTKPLRNTSQRFPAQSFLLCEVVL